MRRWTTWQQCLLSRWNDGVRSRGQASPASWASLCSRLGFASLILWAHVVRILDSLHSCLGLVCDEHPGLCAKGDILGCTESSHQVAKLNLRCKRSLPKTFDREPKMHTKCAQDVRGANPRWPPKGGPKCPMSVLSVKNILDWNATDE